MAPFKLKFSKMSKSRSNGSKGSRSNSVDREEPGQFNNQPNSSNIQALASCNSRPETPATEATGFPDSPPPSYQHVLEETRLSRSTTNSEENVEEEDEEDVEGEESSSDRWKNKLQGSDQSREMERNFAGGGDTGRTVALGPEIIHKSSKELYRAVAKQWGITCKMSDHCRCFDCQSHYFDCEYEQDEQGKSDGGLSAGTPMFIAEVIHGTVCVLL